MGGIDGLTNSFLNIRSYGNFMNAKIHMPRSPQATGHHENAWGRELLILKSTSKAGVLARRFRGP